MERRFDPRSSRGFYIAALAAGCLVFSVPALRAAEESPAENPPPVSDNTAASLEMIAERMKSLSGSLAEIPAPPQLNQVIQLPGASPSASSDKFTNSTDQEETEK